MILSRRFVPILIALLVITSGFVLRSVGAGKQLDPCRDPEALKQLELIPGTWDSVEKPVWYTTRRRQWTVAMAGGDRYNNPLIRTRMIRDFGIFLPWLHPTAGIGEDFRADEERLEWIETSAGKLPVHLRYQYTKSRVRIIAYGYVYGLEPVASPFGAALRDSFRAVVEGSHPLTVMLVAGAIEHGRLPVLQDAAIRWLADAFLRYEEVCRP